MLNGGFKIKNKVAFFMLNGLFNDFIAFAYLSMESVSEFFGISSFQALQTDAPLFSATSLVGMLCTI